MGNTNSREGSIPSPPSQPPPSIHPKPDASDAEVCPVDHKTREAWLAQAREKAAAAQPPPPTSAAPLPSIPAGESCDSTSISQSAPPPSAILSKLGLDQTREISTIPRAAPTSDTEGGKEAKPANNEIESGKDKSGKWIYPSEQMFFEAMRRKNYDPKAEDMRSIVPIHNAVNERAWSEILEWEKGQGSETYVSLSYLSISRKLPGEWIC
jgi:cytochrome c heme-lyase